MPMRDQPVGVHRVRREGFSPGAGQPVNAYDIYVDGEFSGWVERLRPGKPDSAWRAYLGNLWPRKFLRPGGYLAAVEWMSEAHRAAKATAEPVTVAESGSVEVLSPVVADPFRGDQFADPLA